MDTIILLQEKWSQSPHVPLYLFLGGLAAGTLITAVVCDFAAIWSRRAAVAARVAAYAAVPVLALAGFFLTAHLGKPERGLAFPLFFTNYESWMTRGGWIVGAATLLIVVYAGLWFFGLPSAIRRVVGVLALVAATALGVYTGLLLSGAGFVPLWSHDYLPLLFLNSGLNTGLALVALLTVAAWPWLGPRDAGSRPVVRWLGAALLVFLALEAAELYRFMRDLSSEGLLRGHTGPPTADRFQYEVGGGGRLAPGTSYVALVTWVNNATGAEEGASAETPIRLGASDSQVTIRAPRRLGLTYNVYFGPSTGETRQVAANLGPGERAVIGDLAAPTTQRPPENIQTGGHFLAASGGPLAYHYVTGGPGYPRRLFGSESAAPLRGFPAAPTLVRDAPRVSLAEWFWWGVIGLALVVPAALTAVELLAELGGPRVANAVAVVKCLSVLAGGLILRFVIVWGGDLKAPLAFPPSGLPLPLPGGLPFPGVPLPGVGG